MIVVDHRPPRRRIDLTPQRSCPSDPMEPEGVRALRELGERLKYERIWRTVVQASQGQGSIEE